MHFELCMGIIRCRFNLCGPYPWVLDGKGTGNNYNFLETIMFPGFNNHPGNPWTKRELGHNYACGRKTQFFPGCINGTKLMKQFVAIPYCSGCWRFKKGKGCRIPEFKINHSQDDFCQI